MSEMQKADPVARKRTIILLLVLMVVGHGLLYLAQTRMPLDPDWLTDNSESITKNPLLVYAASALFFSPMLGMTFYLILLGQKIVKAQRFPLPGKKVIRDTRVIEGPSAVTRGRLLQVMSLLIFGLLCGVTYTLGRIILLFAEGAA